MEKRKRLPRKLYVRYEKDGDFYQAEEKTDAFDEDSTIGIYELKGTRALVIKRELTPIRLR